MAYAWAILGHLGAILVHLGPFWGILGSSWGHLGAILEPSWAILSHLGAILGAACSLRPFWDSHGVLKAGFELISRSLSMCFLGLTFSVKFVAAEQQAIFPLVLQWC